MPKSSKCCYVSLSICCIPLLAASIFFTVAFTRGYAREPAEVEGSGTSFYSTLRIGGYPVFSNNANSSAIAGIETQWNKGLIFPPLQGWIGSTRPRFRVFRQADLNDDATREYYSTQKDHPTGLYFMETAGYILVVHFFQSKDYLHRAFVISLDDGKVRSNDALLSNAGLGYPAFEYAAVPSRDGGLIASAVEIPEGGVKVVMVDSESLEMVADFDPIVLNITNHNLAYFWDDSDSFVITGAPYPQQGAEEVGQLGPSVTLRSDGSVSTDGGIPPCLSLPSSSSQFRPGDGAYIRVTTSLEIETVLPGTESYPNMTGWQLCDV